MTRTTPPRPLDVEALFPELAAHRGTTTRLHPRPGKPTVADSLVVGNWGQLNIFACPAGPGHPHRLSIQ